ncbi:MAG: universal stress protein [Actinomycetota bacterium]|nr:universal stress protein [Actinomycetota bacterium]
MSVGSTKSEVVAPVLLCFDGSEDAAAAIAKAGRVLSARPAVVLAVWEPVRAWAAYDPATIISAPLAKLVSEELGLDALAEDLAREDTERGLVLARDAGFEATSRVACGKAWPKICEVAEELDVELIVVGARGLGRVESALLGGVSAAVVAHAKRPVLVVPAHGGD